MVNTVHHWVKMFIRYIHHVTTRMLDELLCAVGYCHAVHIVLHVVK